MSGICGLVDFDAPRDGSSRAGDPSIDAVLQRMLACADYRGPDGTGSRFAAVGSCAVALAHQALHTTPESIGERQPVASRNGEILLVADVRLDNRQELISALGVRGETPGDAELLLAAYRRWGTRCPEHLAGDFAFAVWDGLERRFFCARDPFGVKPLVYARLGTLLCFASEVRQVLLHPAVPRRLDEIAAGAYLSGLGEDLERTFFAGVRRLPPAHRLTATPGRVVVERYWDVDPERRLRFPSDEDCAAEFRELFRQAIADRLRAAGDAVGVTLSGGLDSSSVAALACEHSAETGGPLPIAGTFVFERLPECDERSWTAPLAAELGLETLEIEADRPWPLRRYTGARCDQDSPAVGWELAYQQLLEQLRQRGVRVLLTGLGGDEIIGGSALVWAERLRRGDLRVLVEIVRHARWRGLPLGRSFYHGVAAPLAPPAMGSTLRRLAGRSPLPPWIARDFARRTALGPRATKLPPRRFRQPARQEIYDNLVSYGHTTAAASLHERRACHFGLEVRHPFVDRRLFEFVLAIPSRHLFQARRFKPLLQRAMAGILPEVVRRRQAKTSFGTLIDQVLRNSVDEIQELLAAPFLAELGWVDLDRLRAACETGPRDDPPRSVWRAMTLELWLRRHAALLAGASRPAPPDLEETPGAS